MSTSQRTFDQVKNILGKLDQRIDALRERRTTDPAPALPHPHNGTNGHTHPHPHAHPAPTGTAMNGAGMHTTIGSGAAAVTPLAPIPAARPTSTLPLPAAPSGSRFGRATPIRPGNN